MTQAKGAATRRPLLLAGTNEARVLAALAEEDNEGSDRANVVVRTGLTAAQVSDALQRLRRKGFASCARWRETSVWWRS